MCVLPLSQASALTYKQIFIVRGAPMAPCNAEPDLTPWGNFVRAFDFSSVALKQVDSVLFQRYINTAFVFARRTKLQQKSKPCKQLLRQLAFVYVDENIGLQYKDIAQKMTQRLLTQMQDGNAKE